MNIGQEIRMNRLNLYRCTESSLSYFCNIHHYDGVNLYMQEIERAGSGSVIHVYGCVARTNFRQELICLVTAPNLSSPPVDVRYKYYLVNNELYIAVCDMSIAGIRILLVYDGKICDELVVETVETVNIFPYPHHYAGGSVIGHGVTVSEIIEYFICSNTRKILSNRYKRVIDLYGYYQIVSDEMHICVVCNDMLEIISKHQSVISQVIVHPNSIVIMSRDKRYICISTPGEGLREVDICDSLSRNIIKNIRCHPEMSSFTNVDGLIAFNPVDGEMLSVIDKHGEYREIANSDSYGTLRTVTFGKILSKAGGLYQFSWDWRLYRLQQPEIKRTALYIFMVLTLHCGIVKHIAKIIGEIAMSP